MIVKVLSHKKPDFKKLLNYMMNNKDRLFDASKESFVFAHNLLGDSIDEWEKQFKENETYREHKRKNSTYITHEILSWSKEDVDNISLEKMEDMAREYVMMRNPNGMYVAVPHFDKNHYHVHICAAGIEYRTGRTMRMSKQDFGKLKKDIQAYQKQKFPELSKSIVEHGKAGKV